mmetsp:Transcript_45133/g.107349  ORF Transcript_45133/g.107349 Transcript_45133/m.107349 type:complete len:207 (-) Transcript_45133:3428-4048(-)
MSWNGLEDPTGRGAFKTLKHEGSGRGPTCSPCSKTSASCEVRVIGSTTRCCAVTSPKSSTFGSTAKEVGITQVSSPTYSIAGVVDALCFPSIFGFTQIGSFHVACTLMPSFAGASHLLPPCVLISFNILFRCSSALSAAAAASASAAAAAAAAASAICSSVSTGSSGGDAAFAGAAFPPLTGGGGAASSSFTSSAGGGGGGSKRLT